MKLLIIFIFLIIAKFSYASEKPDIKNLVLIKDPKIYEGVVFKNINQKNVDLDDFKGKLIILNFWATWCAPCIREIPAFVKFYDENSDHVEILGLDFEPVDLVIINDYVERFSINYPIVLYDEDNDSEYSNFGEIVGMPTTQIYSPEGQLLHTFMGEITIDDLNKFIVPAS